MPETLATAADRQRRARLEALGIELLQLRESLAHGGTAEAHDNARDASVAPASVRIALLLEGGAGALHGRYATQLAAILAALGLSQDHVGFDFDATLPSLAFGPHPQAALAGLRAPDLAALRSASSKRALWPALRQLRRRLHAGVG